MTGTSHRTTIWLVRHGEVHNPDSVLYGRLPRFGLSERGRAQAEAIARLLAPRSIAAVYSSPLLRARTTAGLIADGHRHLRVRIDRDLLEVRSAWQGRPNSELEEIGFNTYDYPLDPDDDTLESIRQRMCRWVHRALRRHPGQELVGVSHGDPMLILVAELRGIPMDRRLIFPSPYIEPATVFRLEIDDRGRLVDCEMRAPEDGTGNSRFQSGP